MESGVGRILCAQCVSHVSRGVVVLGEWVAKEMGKRLKSSRQRVEVERAGAVPSDVDRPLLRVPAIALDAYCIMHAQSGRTSSSAFYLLVWTMTGSFFHPRHTLHCHTPPD